MLGTRMKRFSQDFERKIRLGTTDSSPGTIFLIKRRQAIALHHEKLTPRERDILKAIAKGKSNKIIAHDFSLTEGAVKGYVSVVLSKLGVTDRIQAALYAAK